MSERQEKKKRCNRRLRYIAERNKRLAQEPCYNKRLQCIAEFNRWLVQEPPKWKLITWIKWKRQMPRWEET